MMQYQTVSQGNRKNLNYNRLITLLRVLFKLLTKILTKGLTTMFGRNQTEKQEGGIQRGFQNQPPPVNSERIIGNSNEHQFFLYDKYRLSKGI